MAESYSGRNIKFEFYSCPLQHSPANTKKACRRTQICFYYLKIHLIEKNDVSKILITDGYSEIGAQVSNFGCSICLRNFFRPISFLRAQYVLVYHPIYLPRMYCSILK